MRSAVKETLQKANVKVGDRLIVAVSGGVDSLVLLHLLRDIADEMTLELTVCHVDHQMREASASDARKVEDLCRKWRIVCRTRRVDVWERVRMTGQSPEEAARDLRYGVLYCLSEELGNAKIVLAHHQDDQAETVLLHLLRGSGIRGLGAMRSVRGRLLRPLLTFAKHELETYAQEHGLIPCEDMTNYDTRYLRNRIRHDLLPVLTSYQPQIRKGLCQLAELSQDDDDFLETMAERYWDRIVRTKKLRCEVDRAAFRQAPIAMQRRIIRRAVQTVGQQSGGVSFTHSERLRQTVADGRVGAVCPLGERGILRCDYDQAIFQEKQDMRAVKLTRRELTLGHDTVIEQADMVICAEIKDALDGQEEAVFDAAAVSLPLHVRGRRAGDVIATHGKTGKKKLKKELIDCKIAVLERDRLPLVCDADDTILWVVGIRKANIAEVNSDTKQYLCLKSKRR